MYHASWDDLKKTTHIKPVLHCPIEFCVVEWHLVSVGTFSVMYDHLFSIVANHHIFIRPTHNIGWQMASLSPSMICVGIHVWVNILTVLPLRDNCPRNQNGGLITFQSQGESMSSWRLWPFSTECISLLLIILPELHDEQCYLNGPAAGNLGNRGSNRAIWPQVNYREKFIFECLWFALSLLTQAVLKQW